MKAVFTYQVIVKDDIFARMAVGARAGITGSLDYGLLVFVACYDVVGVCVYAYAKQKPRLLLSLPRESAVPIASEATAWPHPLTKPSSPP